MRKLLSFIATSAILLNSFYAPLTAIAQEMTPTPEPTPEATSTPEPTQTPEATIAPTEEPTVTPESTPTEIASPTPEVTVPPTDTGSPEPTEEVGQETEPQDPESNPTTTSPPESSSPEASSTPIFTPVVTDENAEISTQVVVTELIPEVLQENNVIKLITDKLDYAPSEIAIISGTGFIPERTYALTVSSADDPATSTTVDVTTDSDGGFTYNYQLDGNYRPNYLVEVKDGEELIATTSFTDSSTQFEYGSFQGEIAPYDSNNWTNGNISGYHNGDNVRFRIQIESPSNSGSYNGHLKVGFTSKTSCRFFNYANPTNIALDFNVATNAIDSGTGMTATLNGISQDGNDAIADFTISSTQHKTTRLNFTLQFANNASTCGSGSSQHVEINSTSGAIKWSGNKSLPVPANAVTPVPTTGTIVIVKDSQPDSSQDFAFTTTGTGLSSFSLDDDTNATLSNTKTFTNINAGTYTVSETPNSNWNLTNLTCVDPTQNSGVSASAGNTASINLAAGETVTCTFTNVRKTGLLRIEKLISPVDDGNTFQFDLTSADGGDYDAGGYTLGSGNHGVLVVPTGNHTWTETTESGYSTSYQCADLPFTPYSGSINYSAPVTGNSVTFTLEENHEYWCKFINTKILGSISGMKFNDMDGNTNKNAGEAGLSGWTIYLDSDNDGKLDSGERSTVTDSSGNYNFDNLSLGTYRVREVNKSGWKQTTPYHNSYSHVITISNTNPSYTNIDFGNQKLGSIKIIKDAIPDSNDDFSFTTTGSGLSSFTIDDDWDGVSSRTFSNLNSGNYSITESITSGWGLTHITCAGGSNWSKSDRTLSITLAGEDYVCTFTNIEKGGVQGMKYNDLDWDGRKDGAEDGLRNWKIFVDLNKNGDFDDGEPFDITDSHGDYSIGGLLPGNYDVCEVGQEGWFSSLPGESKCQNTTINSNGGDWDELNFGNYQKGSIKVCKVIIDPYNNISNGSLFAGDTFTINWDKGLDPTVFTAGYEPNEKLFSDSEVNDAYCKTISDIPVSTYKYSAEIISNPGNWTSGKYNDQYSTKVIDLKDFYSYGSNTDSNGEINLELVGPSRTLVILNQYLFVEDPKLELTKSNSAGTAIPAGSTITYTLNIKNSGNVGVNNVEVTDFLPGGFTYVAGSTTGATTNDPVISGGKLTWNIGTIPVGESAEISYKVQTANDLTSGTYVNYATCNANTQKPRSEFTLSVASIEVTDQNSTSCNTDDSSVKIDNSLSYSGSLGGQVLGASTMLPATGNPTWMLLVAFGLTGTGIYLNIRSRKENKNVKN